MFLNCLIRLHLEIFELTKSFPDGEKFGLFSQMSRAAYSIPMNLMEGGLRLSRKEYRQFVGIAKGSAGEIKYQLLLVKDLRYIIESKIHELLNAKYERVSQMLTKLAQILRIKFIIRTRSHEHDTIKWRYPLSDIDLGREEEQEVLKVLKSRWLSTGPFTERFEKAFSEYMGGGYAIAVSNGTAALHLALT